MVAEWFGAMGRTWGATPLEDQYIGGGIAWSIGEIPTLILAITVAIQWSRSDERAQRSAPTGTPTAPATPNSRPTTRASPRSPSATRAHRPLSATARPGRERESLRRRRGRRRDRARSSHFVPSRSPRSGARQLVDGGADGRGESVGREALASARSWRSTSMTGSFISASMRRMPCAAR